MCLAFLTRNAAVGEEIKTDLAGRWSGILLVNSLRLHLAVNFSRQADGNVTGELISLDQNNVKVALANISVAGRTVHFSLPSIKGTYDALLDIDGNRMEGDWTQNGSSAGLSLVRVTATQSAPASFVFGPPVEAHVQISPVIFRAGDQKRIAYELWLNNVGSGPLHIQKIEVIHGSETLGVFEGGALEQILEQRCGRNTETGSLGAGCLSIARIWLTLPPSIRPSAKLSHRIVADGQVLDVAPVNISQRLAPVLGPPLRGATWKALNGPGTGSGHWATLIANGGVGRFPDRFAIDWVKVDEHGKTFTGDPSDNKNYYAYGQPVFAVAEGVVASLTDNVPQNKPGSHAVKITRENVCGNSISVKIGEGQFGFYCHMQPGSIRVKLGEHLHQGQVIGLVGNAGDSSEPHLHFQLSDEDSIAGSESLPYLLDSFDFYDSDSKPVPQPKEMPLRDQRVRFRE